MSSVDDLRKMRAGNASASQLAAASAKNQMYNAYAAAGTGPKSQHGGLYMQQSGHTTQFAPETVLGNLPTTFGAMGLAGQSFASPRNSPQFPHGRASDFGPLPMTNAIAAPYLMNGMSNINNQLMWANASHAQPGVSNSASLYAPNLAQGYYGNWHGQYLDHSPQPNSIMNSRNASSEVPSLVTPRRDSDSTNEPEPGTPFTAYTGGFGNVSIIDHSPGSVLAWTPSPNSNYNGKPTIPQNIPVEFQVLLQKDPPIPRAVPAPNSPIKTLDRALQNPHGITNVYIRGLLPDTSDDMLQNWALRFGDIVSSKSIIDHNSGKCKGYGFVKYHNYKDAEKCIRGFHYMGYESSFARESFYSVLKKLSDEKNTNLYVSNLPKDMNEHELASIFGPHKVCSSRILRNGDGSGRGVGFARFETRDVCEQVIKDYNNAPVSKPGGEEHLMQIRYADTKDQKALKQQTTAARNFRTAEYESVTSGRMGFIDPGRLASASPNGSADFETYMAGANGMGQPSEFSPMAARWRPTQLTSRMSTGSNRTVVNGSVANGVTEAAPGDENQEPSHIHKTPTKAEPVDVASPLIAEA